MRPPRRPDRGRDSRDRRPAAPRDATPRDDAPPPRDKAERPARFTARRPDAAAEKPINARASRAARFKADHAPPPDERPARAARSPGRSDAAKPPRAKAERPPSTTTGRRVTGAERAANARAARAAGQRTDDRPTSAVPPSERPAARPVRTRTEKQARAKAAKPARAVRRKAEAGAAPPPIARAPRAATPAAAPPAPRSAASARREPQRIAKLLARAGIASRREIERMIDERRIAIDGVVLETPATIVTSLHGVTVDGQPVDAPTPARLFLFNKPTGFLTAERDPRGRPTIYDRLPRDLPRVMPVGRLDLNTEGLLLLTTDGGLKRALELPATGIPRIYRARAYGEVTQQQLEALIEGVEIEGIRYGQIDANLERRTGRNVWIEMKITEGKNREVRRVLEYLGLQVSRLIRVAYGPFVLADLAPGAVVEVRQHDLVAFRQTLK